MLTSRLLPQQWQNSVHLVGCEPLAHQCAINVLAGDARLEAQPPTLGAQALCLGCDPPGSVLGLSPRSGTRLGTRLLHDPAAAWHCLEGAVVCSGREARASNATLTIT